MNSNTDNNSDEYKPSLNDLLKINKFLNSEGGFHGYLVKSTAPINVEDKNKNNTEYEQTTEDQIDNIAKILAETEDSEVVVRIHGYSTEDPSKSYKDMIDTIKSDVNNKKQTVVFLGYQWPSESPNVKNFWKAMPILPRRIVQSSLVIISSYFIVKLFLQIPILSIILGILSIVSGLLSSIILTLILLRFSAYFRDSYRATNYAASDLVELIRNLDKAINEKVEKSNNVKLSLIGHSMGCYVTTNIVRILSDVFEAEDNKLSKIGKCFTLSRLILVAPDIPVETIMPRRANFLQASLRRFKESYLFSNEGDVVLRIASTAANYFSFPAKDIASGYRLGNITIKHNDDWKGKTNEKKYGIINLNNQDDLLKWLEVRSSDKNKVQENKTLDQFPGGTKKIEVANKFTYFDCTDYKDDNNKTPVSLSAGKKALNFWDYAVLVYKHLLRHEIDTHGGYFDGDFTKKLIYRLAFFGFDESLDFYQGNQENTQKTSKINNLSQECKNKQIQVLLSKK